MDKMRKVYTVDRLEHMQCKVKKTRKYNEQER